MPKEHDINITKWAIVVVVKSWSNWVGEHWVGEHWVREQGLKEWWKSVHRFGQYKWVSMIW